MSTIRVMEAYAQRASQMPEQPGIKNAALNAGKALGAVQGVTQRPVSAAVIVSISANAFGASQNAKSENKVKRAAASVTPGVKSYEASMRISSGKAPVERGREDMRDS